MFTKLITLQREPITLGTGIVAGAAAIGGGANAIAQGKMNRKTLKFNKEMYGWQRRDALADWNMNNDYNSPSSQMARLKAAGLNPNLVYGKGADNTAAPVRSSDPKAWNPEAPNYGNIASAGATAYQQSLQQQYNIKQSEAQTDNLREQNNLLIKEGLVKDQSISESLARIANMNAQTAKSKFDLSLGEQMKQYSLDIAKETARKLNIEATSTFNADERAAIMQASNLSEAVVRIAKMRAETGNINEMLHSIRADVRLKVASANLQEAGINPNDSTFERTLARYLNQYNILEKPREVLGKVQSFGAKHLSDTAIQGKADRFMGKYNPFRIDTTGFHNKHKKR